MPPASCPTPARILVIGAGGRENALGWALARSPGVEAVWITPGNGGSCDLPGCQQLAIAESDHDALMAACRDLAIELVVVGPEAPWLLAWPTACAPRDSLASARGPMGRSWRQVSSGLRR